MNMLYHGEIVISKDRKVNKARKILEEYRPIFHYEVEIDKSKYADSIIYKCPYSYTDSAIPVRELLAD